MADAVLSIADWIHPPDAAAEHPLPARFRFAAVIGFQSDRLKRNALIELLPSADDGSPEPALLLTLRDVTSVRASTHVLWPGGLAIPPDTIEQERARRIADFKAKSTEVSIDFEACEGALSAGGFVVLDGAWLALGDVITLRLDVVDGRSRGYALVLRSGAIDVTTADGTPLALEKL
jgi:hypothetical protein